MSWRGLNDSLNTLKGQISNFANNVLAEDNTDVNHSNTDVEELQRVCARQQEEIRKLSQELKEAKGNSESTNNDFNKSDTSWAWEVSEPVKSDKINTADEIITNLKEKIQVLEKEKGELVANLELLDADFQENTEKLAGIKDKLQADYNELEDNYGRLKEAHESLVVINKNDRKQLERLEGQYRELLDKTAEVTRQESCGKCEDSMRKHREGLGEIEKLKNEINVLNSNNDTLTKVLEDTRKANDEELNEIKSKLKLSESENKILIGELQKTKQEIAEFMKKSETDAENCNKLALVLEGYEQQVSSLKEELRLAQNEKQTVTESTQLQEELNELSEQLSQVTKDREQIHGKYINILTEHVKKYTDCDKSSVFESCTNEDDPNLIEFNHQVDSIMKILTDLQCKCDNLETDLYQVTQEKTDLLTEKNHEIEKLMENSEMLSQEIIKKSQALKAYDEEYNEILSKNKQLFNRLEEYKNKSTLQTISESSEDSLVLLESQLELANKKIASLEHALNIDPNSLHYVVPESGELQLDISSYRALMENFNELRKNGKALKQQEAEVQRLNAALEKTKLELENAEYQYSEACANVESLREELADQRIFTEKAVDETYVAEAAYVELQVSYDKMKTELKELNEKLSFELEARADMQNQTRNLTEKLQNAKMYETSLKLQLDTMAKEVATLTEDKTHRENKLKNVLDEWQKCQEKLAMMQEENDQLKRANLDFMEKIKANEVEITRRDEIIERLNKEEKQFEDLAVEQNQDMLNQLHISPLKKEPSPNDMEVDLTNKFELINLSSENEEKMQQGEVSIVEERDNLLAEIARLNQQHQSKVESLEKMINELNASKDAITNTLLTKHQESVTYHNEIQRLSQILNAEVQKSHNLELQLQSLKSTVTSAEVEKNAELEKLSDQNSFLRQKCEVLAENLLQEQAKLNQIMAERSAPSEKEQALAKKLERLQTHLIEVEEHYTQELLKAEEKNAELQAKVSEIEQREKNSSTMYTSVSIRANQHVETLQHQLQTVTNQRDELRKKISDAEDNANRQAAALANLQFVLEQFQKDKENDVLKETERIRRQIAVEKQVQDDLRAEISSLQSQLVESKQGLQAASRLSDQLEQSKVLVATLKGEVSQLKEKLNKSEELVKNLSSQTDGKVDKSLIKNLIIGFVTTNNNLNKDQMQILKIIATVLDFNQQDHDRVNLNKPQQGWLSSFLAPQSSQGMSQESLSQAFVKFLENESKPRIVPSLLNGNDSSSASRKSSTATAPRQSPIVLSEVVLPTFADFAQNRNSSSILKDVLKDNS